MGGGAAASSDRRVDFGMWPSPLSPEMAAAGGPRFAGVALSRDPEGAVVLWWSALEEGVNGVWRTVPGEPPHRVHQVHSARSRVNEYGGGGFWVHGEVLFWVEDDDQCIRALDTGDPDGVPTVLTSAGPHDRALRHAAGVVESGGRWMVVERELHAGDDGRALAEPVNDLAWVSTAAEADGPGGDAASPRSHALVRGADFCAAPTLSPDGRHLAWLQWNHPDMPWDAAALWAAEIVTDGAEPAVVGSRRVAGGRGPGGTPVAACLPDWSPEGRLWWCDDREDLWLLRLAPEPGLPDEAAGDAAAAAHPGPGEVGAPRWVSGGGRYGFGGGALVLARTVEGLDQLDVVPLDPGRGTPREDPARPERHEGAGSLLSWVDTVVVDGEQVAAIAGSATEPTAVVLSTLVPGSGTDGSGRGVTPPRLRARGRYHAADWPLPERSISVPEPITFHTTSRDRLHDGQAPATEFGDAVAHGLFYAPRLEGVSGPGGERPPLVVRIHGGPTAHARAELSPSVQFWTTRGFAVVEVNHRGSTGFGRAYRDLLKGYWGEMEVQDCIAAAEHLAATGRVDARRCVIRGGSAGGFTALEAVCAPTSSSGFRFAAATTLYGVTDLMALAVDTHKFESRYLDGLVGPLPEAEAVYRGRSPLQHPERIGAPVLILQGLEDPVVPPAQAEVLVTALAVAGIDHEYRTYPGEGHGFRNTATIVDALGAELAFYRRVLGIGAG